MSKCNSCKYRAAKGQLWKCEYISIVGHSRGCLPGDDCTKYKRGRRLPIPNIFTISIKCDEKQELMEFLKRFRQFD